MKNVLLAIAGFVAVLAFGFFMNLLGVFQFEFFGKKMEAARYEIHKESQTYRDGLQRDIDNMIREHSKADAVGKRIIEQAMIHQFSQTDVSVLPAYQQDFLRTVGIY